jgi:hypothetical protein
MDFLSRIMERARAIAEPLRDLSDFEFVCHTCGEAHTGLMDLGADAPDAYLASSANAQEAEFLKNDDLCVWNDEHFFVRCVLPIPVQGLDDFFGFGAWSSLSRDNFALYREHWDHPARDGLGPWFGWLSNAFRPYADSLNLPCNVHPQDDGQRPFLELHDGDHPLIRDQREGITIERLMEIYAANGHGP